MAGTDVGLTTSSAGVELIARYEGFRSHLYNDAAGHATIGYGYLVHHGPIDGSEPEEFRKGISRNRAKELLTDKIKGFESSVRDRVRVPIVQKHFDSLVSFTYNLGSGNLAGMVKSSRLNEREYDSTPGQMRLYDKADGRVLAGLTRRRNEEANLFAAGTEEMRAAPTSANHLTSANDALVRTMDPGGVPRRRTKAGSGAPICLVQPMFSLSSVVQAIAARHPTGRVTPWWQLRGPRAVRSGVQRQSIAGSSADAGPLEAEAMENAWLVRNQEWLSGALNESGEVYGALGAASAVVGLALLPTGFGSAFGGTLLSVSAMFSAAAIAARSVGNAFRSFGTWDGSVSSEEVLTENRSVAVDLAQNLAVGQVDKALSAARVYAGPSDVGAESAKIVNRLNTLADRIQRVTKLNLQPIMQDPALARRLAILAKAKRAAEALERGVALLTGGLATLARTAGQVAHAAWTGLKAVGRGIGGAAMGAWNFGAHILQKIRPAGDGELTGPFYPNTMVPLPGSPEDAIRGGAYIYVNGVATDFKTHEFAARRLADELFAQHGRVIPVVGIFNATGMGKSLPGKLGVLRDFGQVLSDKLWDAGRLVGLGNPAIQRLAGLVLKYGNMNQESGGLHIVAHSQGSLIVSEALRQARNKGANLENTDVTTFGNAAYTFPKGANYHHYTFDDDLVPTLFGTSSVTSYWLTGNPVGRFIMNRVAGEQADVGMDTYRLHHGTAGLSNHSLNNREFGNANPGDFGDYFGAWAKFRAKESRGITAQRRIPGPWVSEAATLLALGRAAGNVAGGAIGWGYNLLDKGMRRLPGVAPGLIWSAMDYGARRFGRGVAGAGTAVMSRVDTGFNAIESIQRSGHGDHPDVDAGALRAGLLQQSSGFMPDTNVRGRLAGHLGFDPANARLHTGPAAAAAARDLKAEAFTIGRDVFFGANRYDPASPTGLGLIAHELTHVGQQTGASGGASARFFSRQGGDAMEREAQQTAERVLANVGNPNGLFVEDYVRTYEPEDGTLSEEDVKRLDRISLMALELAANSIASSGISSPQTSELDLQIQIDLNAGTDEELASSWAAEIARCIVAGETLSQRTEAASAAVQRTPSPQPSPAAPRATWLTALPRAIRGKGQHIGVTLHDTKKPPTLTNVDPPKGTASPRTPEVKAIIDAIRKHRAGAPGKVSLHRYQKKYGYAYAPKPTASLPSNAAGQNRASEVQRIVWEELQTEGADSSINAYDSQMLTWGKGFAARTGQLKTMLMPLLVKNAGFRDALLEYGIAFDPKTKTWLVVNLKAGVVESGDDALALIQADPSLLNALAGIAEDPEYKQTLVDAEWSVMSRNAGNVPKYAYTWPDPLIALVAHISHWGPMYGWGNPEYADPGLQVDGAIKAFAHLWSATHASEIGGAYVINHPDAMTNFRLWGKGGSGTGIAAQYITQQSARPLPVSALMARRDELIGRVLVRGPNTAVPHGAKEGAKSKATDPSYYVLPALAEHGPVPTAFTCPTPTESAAVRIDTLRDIAATKQGIRDRRLGVDSLQAAAKAADDRMNELSTHKSEAYQALHRAQAELDSAIDSPARKQRSQRVQELKADIARDDQQFNKASRSYTSSLARAQAKLDAWSRSQKLPYRYVATPYGSVEQEQGEFLDARTLASRAMEPDDLGSKTLYKIGTTGRSHMAQAQFWMLENPAQKDVLSRYGIPTKNLRGPMFMMTAKMKRDAPFVTRPAAPYHDKDTGEDLPGGAPEVVVGSGYLTGLAMHMFSPPEPANTASTDPGAGVCK